MRTGVVIPYYQRSPGILSSALESAFSQTSAPDFQIFVVDDSSPVPAEIDVATLAPGLRRRITITRQANGGPGAARNAALDQLPSDIEFIAFLDSDDRWQPNHLSNGLAALAQGYDVYFSNLLDFDSPLDYFQRRGGIWREEHTPIPGMDCVFEFTGRMSAQILAANFVQMSTVIYRRAAAPKLRFRTEFRRAGEDLLYWLELASRTNAFCYSTRIEVHYGRGVNVYRSATSGTEGAFERLRDETKFRRTVLKEFAREATDYRNARSALRNARKQFAAELLYRLRRTRSIDLAAINAQWRLDPWSVLALPVNCTRCAADWFASTRAAPR